MASAAHDLYGPPRRGRAEGWDSNEDDSFWERNINTPEGDDSSPYDIDLHFALSVIEEDVLETIRKEFVAMDKEMSGAIDVKDLPKLLDVLGVGHHGADETGAMHAEDVYHFLSYIEQDDEGRITYAEFVEAFKKMRESQLKMESDLDTLAAWTALGGHEDGSGSLDTALLVKMVRDDFQLPDEVVGFVKRLDYNNRGHIDYDGFCEIFQPCA
ncbi:unnamed protein product [Vitrella brassicaformis CCMP3155]|uniref:EF-hand domain-containing protein n=1 Tax=Vitrella brassicaformis (strain CCMP3155) TaxID=1169540 RepID=A0A0G4F6Y8_VITBC|nr:unnamed protein product [Vitrella brassicaformis CCMP3155]|mmetsp:Transcript_51859/g.130270  ORF Transcript_51859/g.130270 Transcript_51859/m.130270 type:complete len:213 (-) Transcript_51859:150-788(-)|eukprot:CEM08007.1 unnamed protein product [Vitrella brassicaformis CCMP3155]